MPNLHNVIADVREMMFPANNVNFIIHQRSNRRWVVYVNILHAQPSGKMEFIINENPNNPEDTEVLGSVLRHGCVRRRTMSLIMDSIIERM